MNRFDATAFKIGMWVIGFTTLAVVFNAIPAHQWTLLKWTLALASVVTLGLYKLCLPEKPEAEAKASGMIMSAGMAGLAAIVFLALVWFEVPLAILVVLSVIVLATMLISCNTFGFAMGKTFAVSLPSLFVVQLVAEQFQMQAPF